MLKEELGKPGRTPVKKPDRPAPSVPKNQNRTEWGASAASGAWYDGENHVETMPIPETPGGLNWTVKGRTAQEEAERYTAVGREGAGEWQDALASQEAKRREAEEARTRKYGEFVMSEFDNIVTRDRERKAEARRMKDATLSAMMLHARNGDGFVPPSLLEAASQNMGFPVAGGNFDENGNFLLYTAAKGQDGRAQFMPAAIASPEMQLGTLSRAQMGIGMQRDVYRRLSERYTPSQLEKRGIRNPDAPVSSGGVTFSGGTARRLGASVLGPERRGISAFGANGWGGFTRYESSEDTGHRLESKDFGTRAPSVRDDETERERIARMNNDARARLQERRSEAAQTMARTNADAAKYKADAMERIAEIRAAAKAAGGLSYKGKDLKDVASILSDPLADEETKTKAREILNAIADTLKGGSGETAESAEADEADAEKPKPSAVDTQTAGPLRGRKPDLSAVVDEAIAKLDPTSPSWWGGQPSAEKPKPSGAEKPKLKRTYAEIRSDPRDGDLLPLKGGLWARYNAATKKWEKSN